MMGIFRLDQWPKRQSYKLFLIVNLCIFSLYAINFDISLFSENRVITHNISSFLADFLSRLATLLFSSDTGVLGLIFTRLWTDMLFALLYLKMISRIFNRLSITKLQYTQCMLAIFIITIAVKYITSVDNKGLAVHELYFDSYLLFIQSLESDGAVKYSEMYRIFAEGFIDTVIFSTSAYLFFKRKHAELFFWGSLLLISIYYPGVLIVLIPSLLIFYPTMIQIVNSVVATHRTYMDALTLSRQNNSVDS